MAGEHVPPPRPKRKSTNPYPQKAPKCELGGMGMIAGRNWSNSSSGSSPGSWPQQMLPAGQVLQESGPRAAPDAEVYHFIGSVFDPGVSGHPRKLKEMSSIDRETVILLMRNLSINLSSPDFEEHCMTYVEWKQRPDSVDDENGAPGAGPQSCSVTLIRGDTSEPEECRLGSIPSKDFHVAEAFAHGSVDAPPQHRYPFGRGGDMEV